MSMRFALAIFFLFPVRVCADAELEKAIDALAAKHHVTAKTPGVAVAIIEPGKAPVYKTYGLANIARGTPSTRTVSAISTVVAPWILAIIIALSPPFLTPFLACSLSAAICSAQRKCARPVSNYCFEESPSRRMYTVPLLLAVAKCRPSGLKAI